jgi:hypothetical protein
MSIKLSSQPKYSDIMDINIKNLKYAPKRSIK